MIADLKPYPATQDPGGPWLGEGGIDAFVRREVLPHAADALCGGWRRRGGAPLYTGLRKVITKSAFLSAKMPLPPTGERAEVVKHVQERLRTSDEAADRARSEIGLLKEYRTRLIADVVTGKLDVREAAARLPDEPDELELADEAEAPLDAEESQADDLDAIPEELDA